MKDFYRTRPLPLDSASDGHRLLMTPAIVDGIARQLPKQVWGRYHENILYLAGKIEATSRYATDIIVPKAKTSPGSYMTSRESHAEVLFSLSQRDLVIVGQVHCHPASEVYHSDADDELAFIKGDGFWSIVVPYYGRRGMIPFNTCGVHCYTNHSFRLLNQIAVKKRVVIAKSGGRQ